MADGQVESQERHMALQAKGEDGVTKASEASTAHTRTGMLIELGWLDNYRETVLARQQIEYGLALEGYRRDVRNYERRLLWTRVAFLLCGFLIVVSSVLFFVFGVWSLIESLRDVQGSIYLAEVWLGDSINLTNSFIDFQAQAQQQGQELLNYTENVCRGNEDAPEDGLEEFDAVSRALDGFIEFIQGTEKSAELLADDLTEAQRLAEDTNDALDKAYPYLYALVGASAALNIIVVCLMAFVAMAWKRKKVKNRFVRCMKLGVVLPLFFFFMFLSWLFASLFLVVSIGGSDFCITPDQNSVLIVDKVEERFSPNSLLMGFVRYYISNCASELPPYLSNVKEAEPVAFAVNAIHNFLEFLSADEHIASSICGSDTISAVNKAASFFHDQLHIVVSLLYGLIEILQCSSVNPIYTKLMHSGICVNGINGITWMFGTQITIAVCSMSMITMRAAMKRGEDEEELHDSASTEEGDTDSSAEDDDCFNYEIPRQNRRERKIVVEPRSEHFTATEAIHIT